MASMNYFDSDKSKSTNTVVYFDWKTVIHIYVYGQCHTQFMLPKSCTITTGKSVTCTGACANEIIPNRYIARLFTKGKKDVMLEYNVKFNVVC